MKRTRFYPIRSCNIKLCLSKIIYFKIFFLVLYSCGIKEETKEEILPVLTIEEAFEQNNYISLSEFTQGDIEYVRLETKPESLLGINPRFYADNRYIIGLTHNQMFLFERGTGRFIRQIGQQGRAPGGYMGTLFTYPYDESKNLLLASGWGQGTYSKYDLDGNLKAQITPREGNISLAPLNDSLYVAYIKNFSGNEKEKLVVLDNQSNIVKTFPNYLEAEVPENERFWLPTQGWFYKYNDQLCFYELFTDTIYQVTMEELIPRFVFDLGKFAPPYERQSFGEFIVKEIRNYYQPGKIFETDNYLVFEILYENVAHMAIYNKETEKIAFAESAEGFENDVDNFLSMNYNFLNSHNELIGYWEAYKIEKWFEENPDKAAQLPPHLKKLENLTENDNPVVMIARLKE